VITAAALCPAPPLLARELTGADPVLPELRHACRDAAKALLDGDPELVVVVGVADRTLRFDATSRLELAGYAPGPAARAEAADGPLVAAGAEAPPAPGAEAPPAPGGQAPTAPGDGAARTSAILPLPLGLGGLLLDQVGYQGGRLLQSVRERETAAGCAALGARLAGAAGRVALLVMADGSARRGLRAPGYLDERSVPFDSAVEHAVRRGDLAALLAIDADLARELMATGRAAWQVLAGALAGQRPASEIRYCDDPFGVAYLVASLAPPGGGRAR
jgi:hypothetical protein